MTTKFKENSFIKEELEKSYEIFLDNQKKFSPGSKITKDNYCKIISELKFDDIYLKSPEEQIERIQKILSTFENVEGEPQMLKLFSDNLHFTKLKELEYRNTPKQVKEELLNFFIIKYFRLSSHREKLLTKSNQMLNFHGLNESFCVNKDYKLSKLSTEMDFTLKRIFRLMNNDNIHSKDFEHYLKYFQVKRLETMFVKPEQQNCHFNLRKDDFEIYFRETCLSDKMKRHIASFSSVIKFLPIESNFEIWKKSKIYLNSHLKKLFQHQIKRLKEIYKNEKTQSNFTDLKLFKEYFKAKYKFYYDLKPSFEGVNQISDPKKTNQTNIDKDSKLMNLYYKSNLDIISPPLVISLNSEVQTYLKEFCDYFNIKYDIKIDKGRAFSYSIDLFFPDYFKFQSKNFSYNAYELTYTELENIVEMTEQSDLPQNSPKNKNTSEVLRNKYSITEGFVINNNNNIFNIGKLKNTSFKSEIYVKKATWVDYFCMNVEINHDFLNMQKKLESVVHVDSLLKFELELVEVVDYNTMVRLIDDYTINISARVKNTSGLILNHNKDKNSYSFAHNESESFNPYHPLEEIVKTVVKSEPKTNIGLNHLFDSNLMIGTNINTNTNTNINTNININSNQIKGVNSLNQLSATGSVVYSDHNLGNPPFDKVNIPSDHYHTTNYTHGYIQSQNHNKEIASGNPITETNPNANKVYKIVDSYSDRIDGDLVKYFLILRFLKLRDYKFYILNMLNYFRYIQKKFTINLYKIENKNWKKSEDLSQLTSMLSGTLKVNKSKEKDLDKDEKEKTSQTSHKKKSLKNINDNMENYQSQKDQKNQKNQKDQIDDFTSINNNLIFSQPLSKYVKTNPIIPSLDNLLDSKQDFDEFNRILIDEIDEIVEYSDKIVRIKDSKGNYIIYDATLSDMKQLEEIIAKIATHFINKKEELIIDTKNMTNPIIDRSQVLLDIFINEFDYLYSKFEYVSELMTIYDNTTDIYSQKALMQLIIDSIAARPVIDLEYNYFTPSYLMETDLLRKKAALMHTLIDYQKKKEIYENRLVHESLEKYYWMLGETALELIRHIRIDKYDIELVKSHLNNIKKQQMENESENENSGIELENLVCIFEKVKKDQDYQNLEVFQKENEPNREEDILVESSNVCITDTDQQNNQVKYSDQKFNPEKFIKSLTNFLEFIKKLFNRALTGSHDAFIENPTENLLYEPHENLNFTKNIESIINSTMKNTKKNYTSYSRSFSLSDISLDITNYKIRSLLNIPNPFKESQILNYLEKNPQHAIFKDYNYSKFFEGFPFKFNEVANKNLQEIEFFESLHILIPTLNLIDKTFKNLQSQFPTGDCITIKALGVSYTDHLISSWDSFSELINGKRFSDDFAQISYLQDTLMDSHTGINYILKTLTATLSNNISRIPPQLLVKLPFKIMSKIHIDQINFNIIDSKNQHTELKLVENMLFDDMSQSLINILKIDSKSEWIDFKETFTEIDMHCNLFEFYRMKELIYKLILDNTILKNIYENQKERILNRSDDIFRFKDSLNMLPFGTNKNLNYVDYPRRNLFETEPVENTTNENQENINKKFVNQRNSLNSSILLSPSIKLIQNNKNLRHSVSIRKSKESLDNIDYNLFSNISVKSHNNSMPKFIISEFDPTLQNCINFHSLLQCQINILDTGLIEVKTFAHYEYMNLFLLLISTQHNLNIFFDAMKYSCEVDLFETHRVSTFAGLFDPLPVVKEAKENDSPIDLVVFKCRSKVNDFILKYGREFFYSIQEKKSKNRTNIQSKYANFVESRIKFMIRDESVKSTYARHYRLMMANGYCEDIILETLLDFIKLQASKSVKDLKKLLKCVPQEYVPFEVNPWNFINDHIIKQNFVNKNFLYFKDRTKHWQNFYLPSDIEILRLESQSDHDAVFHLSQFNPFTINEDTNDSNYFLQLKYKFFKSPKECRKIENFRNINFEEAYCYQSSPLLLLQMTTFFINTINFKFLEIGMRQNAANLIDLINSLNSGKDFWGDKSLPVNQNKQNTSNAPSSSFLQKGSQIITNNLQQSSLNNIDYSTYEKPLPLKVVEDIIYNQNNYLNLRSDFDIFKNEMESLIVDMRRYLKPEDNQVMSPHGNTASFQQDGYSEDGGYLATENENKTVNSKISKTTYISKLKYGNHYDSASRHVIVFMQSFTHTKITFWINILYRIRETSIKTNDNISCELVTKILKNFILRDYFKNTDCNHQCHLMDSSVSACYQNPGADTTKKITKNYFCQHFTLGRHPDSQFLNNDTDLTSNKPNLNNLNEFVHNNEYDSGNYLSIISNNQPLSTMYLNFSDYSIYDGVKQDFLFIKDKKLDQMRSLSFNIGNLTEHFMIYKEVSRHNNDLIFLFNKKRDFLELLQKLIEFKYKIMIILKGDFLSTQRDKFETIETRVKKISAKVSRRTSLVVDLDGFLLDLDEGFIDDRFMNIKGIGEDIEDTYENTNTEVLLKLVKNNLGDEVYDKLNEASGDELGQTNNNNIASSKNLHSTARKNISKVLTNRVIPLLIKEADNAFRNYKREIESFYLKKGLDSFVCYNKSITELISQTRNDLDINMFENRFSSNMLKEFDQTGVIHINRKFSFFETFVNYIKNSSHDVETHADSDAMLISKNDFEKALRNLIQEFVTYDSSIQRANHFANCSEKFGYYFTIKKLEIWSGVLKDKLKDYDSNFDKISNAKLALSGNKLVYEMDSLYRQLNVLKSNIQIMEEYIRNYFEDKFKYLINNYKAEIVGMKSKFMEFKEDLVSNTVQQVTEEYVQSLEELKNKLNMLNQSKKKYNLNLGQSNLFKTNQHEFELNSAENFYIDTQEKEFYDGFYREMEIEQNLNREINKERQKNDCLVDDIWKLHTFYRAKLNLQKGKYEKETDRLKETLSSNKDLWDKLAFSERNEIILKEELSKTQKSLASCEEFIKKLQAQIRKLHDKNVNLEKQLSSVTTQQILNKASKGEFKSMELYDETKQTYVYNLKNNLNVVTAIEKVKSKYSADPEIKILIENLEILHTKYTQEIDRKRNYIQALNEVKKDVIRMKNTENKKSEDLYFQNLNLAEENRKLKSELEKLKKSLEKENISERSENPKIKSFKKSDSKKNSLNLKKSESNEKNSEIISEKYSSPSIVVNNFKSSNFNLEENMGLKYSENDSKLPYKESGVNSMNSIGINTIDRSIGEMPTLNKLNMTMTHLTSNSFSGRLNKAGMNLVYGSSINMPNMPNLSNSNK